MASQVHARRTVQISSITFNRSAVDENVGENEEYGLARSPTVPTIEDEYDGPFFYILSATIPEEAAGPYHSIYIIEGSDEDPYRLVLYRDSISDDVNMTCTCKSFEWMPRSKYYNGRIRACKHIIWFVREELKINMSTQTHKDVVRVATEFINTHKFDGDNTRIITESDASKPSQFETEKQEDDRKVQEYFHDTEYNPSDDDNDDDNDDNDNTGDIPVLPPPLVKIVKRQIPATIPHPTTTAVTTTASAETTTIDPFDIIPPPKRRRLRRMCDDDD